MFFALSNGRGHFAWNTLSYVVFPLTSALIIRRQPRNPVGWAVAAMGFIFLFSNTAQEYAFYAYITHPGRLPYADLIVWISNWCWSFGDPFAVAAILLFPNGKPPSSRWWALIALTWLSSLLSAGYSIILLWGARGPHLLSMDLQSAIGPIAALPAARIMTISGMLYVLFLALAVIGLAVRFTRSQGVERQQIKWIFLAVTFVPVSVGLNVLDTSNGSPFLDLISATLNFVSNISVPIAMAFAVTRYHLYDIDVIIRRTLLYTALTVSLALLYFGSVLLLQSLLAKIGGTQSPVSVVLSTLLIAALFSPLRARFQNVIDHRFYRRAYNGEQIMKRFTDRMRMVVDLEAINTHLLNLVDESLQPAFSSLWLVREGK